MVAGKMRNTVCLTFDFDALSVWLGDGTATPSALSRGEYGARVGVPRVLSLLGRYGIAATFFVPGHTADSFPGAVEAILRAGHEVAHHGYGHQDPSSQTAAEERRSLERGLEALARFLGRRPLGYRAPAWDFSPVTLSLLVEYGFAYDSSLFADDYRPYHPRLGDRVGVEEPLRPGQEVDLWELPVDLALDDWPYFGFSFGGSCAGLSSPTAVLQIWTGEFDYMVGHTGGGVLTYTMHPQLVGRGHRMALLEGLIEHVQAHGGADFARLGDVAQELDAAQRETQPA